MYLYHFLFPCFFDRILYYFSKNNETENPIKSRHHRLEFGCFTSCLFNHDVSWLSFNVCCSHDIVEANSVVFAVFFSVPFWSVIAIAVVAALILCCCLICICRYCCRRKKSKDSKKGLKGVVDLKSVQMLGHAYKEKVCMSVCWALVH